METYLMNPDLELYPFEDNKLNVFHKVTGKSYMLGEKESAVLKRLDGSHTLAQIQAECPFYSAAELQGLLQAFGKIGLLAGTGEKKKQPFYKVKIRLFNPNRVMKEHGFLTGLFRGLAMMAPVIFAAGAAFNVFGRRFRFVDPVPAEQILAAFGELGIPMYALLLLAGFLSLVIHELAHAAAARHYGVNVPEIGIMLYWLMPCAYTNLSNIRLLESRGKRIFTLAAGSLSNVSIIGGCYFLLGLLKSPKACAFLLGLILLNLGTICLNFVVFLKFDGYYMLEVLLNEEKLQEKSMGYLNTWVKARLGRNARARETLKQIRAEESGPLKGTLYLLFGAGSLLYLPIFIGQTVLSVIAG